MKKRLALVATGVVVGCAVACLIVHRKVVVAMVKGEPLPEAPASHVWHKCHK